jgi:hypothetical protein
MSFNSGVDSMRKLLAMAAAIAAIPVMAMAGPKIVVPETSWDFGFVPKNGTMSHPYWIKNIGDDTLRVNVKPG